MPSSRQPALSILYCLALQLVVNHAPAALVAALAFSSSATTRMSAQGSSSNTSPVGVLSPFGFAINTRFKVLPSRKVEFLETMTNNVRQSMSTDPNALQLVLGADADDADAFYLHEEFQTRPDRADERCAEFFATEPLAEPRACDEFALLHDGHADKVPNADGAVCLNVELCIKAEVREEFLEVIRQNKEGSDKEPLCLQYSWGEGVDPDATNTFHFHERYIGEEGLAAHGAAPHFKVWEEFASRGDPFAKPPIVQKFKALPF